MSRKPVLRPAYLLVLTGGLLLLPGLTLLGEGRETLLFLAEQRDARADQLVAAQALLAQKPALQEQTKRLEQLSDDASLYHRGADSAAIQITLLAQVRNLIQGAGLAIRSMEARSGDAVGGRQRLTIILSAMGSNEQIMAAIAALETARPRLFIRQLRLITESEAGIGGTPYNPLLALDLEIDAYAQTAAS